ncbi:MAG: 16S rRNA (guanine(527)-N(7))-methyltransferase RsmG [Gaiellaceae bacterium]|jgi:16S rRNA (guanine527-N7)-methyltransferase
MSPERDPRLAHWLEALLETPGLTSIRDPEAAWREHVDDALEAALLISRFSGPIADVGSGGGAPGIPLSTAFPEREVTLIESSERKCRFLERFIADFPNLRVVRGRAEEQPLDVFGVVVAKALAAPPVALEWCLPLVRPGGAAVLYCALLDQDLALIAHKLGGGSPELHPVAGSRKRLLVVVPKLGPTPPGFPRRPGMAKKRPLR